MFTGIVEEIGRVTRIEQRGENRRITVTAEHAPKEPETWTRTSFSRIQEGALVNLELPMKADGRFGGHIVQGHVDGVGKVIAFERIADSENWWLQIELPDDVEKYTVYKGSISVEGISLTVAQLEGNRCTIAVIPHTVEMTNLHSLKPGDSVNVEADLIAKYVEKMIMNKTDAEGSLTVEDLVRQGF